MLAITFADLRFRYRQFLIAVVGAGVVMAMAVLLSGLADGFRSETHWTVGAVGADRWLLNEKSDGRLTAVTTFPASTVTRVGRTKGVTAAQGLIFLPQEVLHLGERRVTVNVMGIGPAKSLGYPDGRVLAAGQALVDARAKIPVGTTVHIGSTPMHVVGTVHRRTLAAGIPMFYMPLRDAQRALFGGQPIVTAVVTKGSPATVPRGLTSMTPKQIEDSTLQSLAGGVQSIRNCRILMWAVAAIIIAALIYVSALQRVRDFAVLKALGSSSTVLFASLCLQAVVVTLLAAALGAAASTGMTGIFPQTVTVHSFTYVTLPVIAVAVGVLSSLVALRRATGADPAAAFGGRG
jgi:putative ABC transport system permease protein